MTELTRRQWIASLGTAVGGVTLGAGCQMLEDDSSSPPSGSSDTSSQGGSGGSGLLAPLTTETQTATPYPTYGDDSTDTRTQSTPTQTGITVETPTQRTTQPTTHAVSVQFAPLKTFSNDEYGYQINRPKPWKITNGESEGKEQGKYVGRVAESFRISTTPTGEKS